MAEFEKYSNPNTGQIIEVPTGTEVTADLLDSLGKEQVTIEKKEVQTNKVQESFDISEALFPRTSKAEGFGESLVGFGLDAVSLLGRGASTFAERGSYMGPRQRGVLESMADIDSKGTTSYGPGGNPIEGNIASEIIKDPATLATVGTGIGAAGWVMKGGKWLPKLAKGMALGAGEGALSSTIHQTENVLQGEDVNLKEAAIETGLSTALPGVASGIGGGLSKFANWGLGKLASQLGNVSEEALRKWGSGMGKGAKELKDVHGKQKQIGDKLLGALENFEEFMPEAIVVKQALKEMPEIPLDKTLKSISSAIEDLPLKKTHKGIRTKLENLLHDIGGRRELPGRATKLPGKKIPKKTDSMGRVIQEESSTTGATIRTKGKEIYDTSMNATKFKKMRSLTDDMINWDDAGASTLNDVLKNIRTTMKDELLDVAKKSGNTDYAKAMEVWSEKLGKRDALLEEIGKTGKVRNRRVGQFLSTLFNKNKEVRQEALGAMTDIFGEDFVKQAKLLQMSDEMIWPGQNIARILPKPGQATTAILPGAAQISAGAMLGQPKLVATGVGTMAMSSPSVSSKVLFATDLAQRAADSRALGEAVSLAGRQKEDK